MTTAGDCRDAWPAWRRMCCSSRKSMEREHFFNADGELLDRRAAEQAALPHRVRRDRDRAGRSLRHPARRDLPRRADRRAGARLCLRELRRRLHAAGSRADRRELPRQCARFPHARSRPTRTSRSRTRCIVKWGGELFRTQGAAFAARRRGLARQLLSLQIRSAALLAGRRDLVRSSRSVDLHGDDLAVGDAGHRQHRFRDLPRALGGGREHVPAALVSPQHHVGVHGAGLRRL